MKNYDRNYLRMRISRTYAKNLLISRPSSTFQADFREEGGRSVLVSPDALSVGIDMGEDSTSAMTATRATDIRSNLYTYQPPRSVLPYDNRGRWVFPKQQIDRGGPSAPFPPRIHSTELTSKN